MSKASTGTINLTVDNIIDDTSSLQVLNFGAITTTGITQRIYSDFHPGFRANYNVTGGTADFKIFVTIHDNSSSTFIENANLAVDVSHVEGDSVQVGDGVEIIQVNPDGSINVEIANTPETRNPVHTAVTGSINTAVDGYGFKSLGSYTSTDDMTRIKAVYMHSACIAQVRLLIDGTEIRRKDVNPLTSAAEICFKVPRELQNAEVISIEARVAPDIQGTVEFNGEIEAFVAD